jgi:hypothetical protein
MSWIVVTLFTCVSCHRPGEQRTLLPATADAIMEAVSLNDAARPSPLENGVAVAAAGNEWTSFALQLRDLPQAEGYWIRVHELELDSANANIGLANFEPAQILPMPVDLDRAGYVRHTGLSTASRNLPRALIPQQFDTEGALNLRALRDPNHPSDPKSHPGGANSSPVLIWVDLHVPAGARAGEYSSRVDLLRAGQDKPVASVPVRLSVYPFALPQERHLQMIGEISWDRLVQHYADRFETVTPRLVNRGDARYADTVRTLDQLISLAQKHRTALYVPRLQPTVKWADRASPPEVDWRDVDSLLAPWLKGYAFSDGVPLTYWPLPSPDLLGNWNRSSQLAYWFQAATHFDQLDLLHKTSVALETISPGRAGAEESVGLSSQAAEILALHPGIRVTLPLEDDQIQFSGKANPKLIDPSTTTRLLTSVPSLVAPPSGAWPQGAVRPEHWLRTDLPGLLPYVGAGGDEHDVRTWAFLAFLRRAKFVMWNSPLPTVSTPGEPADPNELIWFYPGKWFGLDEPVPTMQLKWLRRAEQDFEYLYLARERGEEVNAQQMARLITKPVEIAQGDVPDPTYSLMSGTTDLRAWSGAEKLLAQTIALHQPGQAPAAALQHELYIHTLQWARPQERPLLIGRSAQWSWDTDPQASNLIDLHLGLDIYNASDVTPGGNSIQWAALPPAWKIDPAPIPVASLQTYRVLRTSLDAKFDVTELSPSSRMPMEVDFVDGATHVPSPLRLVLPVAASDRREGRLSIDGSLDDWTENDELQNGPMIVMLNRPALQRQELQRASTPTKLYSAWAAENLYLAFSVQGIAQDSVHRAQNFVTYKDRRAWGEDLSEILIQPVYADPAHPLGTVLHIVCKPNGGVWVERKLDERLHVRPWEVVEGAAVRYANTTPGNGEWLGELAIPWKLIGDTTHGLPLLLRFNFVQHRTLDGESASWCGPIDFGRDDALMGVLFLRTPDAAGDMHVLHGNDTLAQ